MHLFIPGQYTCMLNNKGQCHMGVNMPICVQLTSSSSNGGSTRHTSSNITSGLCYYVSLYRWACDIKQDMRPSMATMNQGDVRAPIGRVDTRHSTGACGVK